MEDRHVRQCLYVVTEEIARRRIGGYPIPSALTNLHRVLSDEVSVQRLRQQWQRDLSPRGHATTEIGSTAGELESTAQMAERLGVSPRTVRRHAKAEGTPLVSGRYVFDREEPS